MCGIICYVGKKEAGPILLAGLRRLEYRGYDSAGIVTVKDGEFERTRSVGNLDRLAGKTGNEKPKGKKKGSGRIKIGLDSREPKAPEP